MLVMVLIILVSVMCSLLVMSFARVSSERERNEKKLFEKHFKGNDDVV